MKLFLVEIIECNSNPCRRGSTCIDEVNRFRCKCVAGITGRRCGISKSDSYTWVKQNGKSIVVKQS